MMLRASLCSLRPTLWYSYPGGTMNGRPLLCPMIAVHHNFGAGGQQWPEIAFGVEGAALLVILAAAQKLAQAGERARWFSDQR